MFPAAVSKVNHELKLKVFSLLSSSVLQSEWIFYPKLQSVSRGLFSEPEVCSYHPGQSGCEEFAAPLPRYPFQIQSGVAAVTHLVALKDCNQWPLIWVTQLSRCAVLMYCELWRFPELWRQRWKSQGRRWGADAAGQRWDSFSRDESSYSAEPPLSLHK